MTGLPDYAFKENWMRPGRPP